VTRPKSLCPTCGGRRALAAERCPTCTKPRSGILPRDLRKFYLVLFARFGYWPRSLFLFVNAVDAQLAAEGDAARAVYLERVRPIEARSAWSEWGLVPPPDVQPPPTYPPFVSPSEVVVQSTEPVKAVRPWEPDMSRTCGGCGQPSVVLGTCGICGKEKYHAE
jgi:hypothetical protein